MLIADQDTFRALQASVRAVLERPEGRDWTVQGFGMLRTYLGDNKKFRVNNKKFRLNIWDSELAVPGVSIIHTHPWHFRSWIIAGMTCNVRFRDVSMVPGLDGVTGFAPLVNGDSGAYYFAPIECGIDAENFSLTTDTAVLKRCEQEFYDEGHFYSQKAEEIHASYYRDGTCTLNDRTRVGDGEHALVYWPQGLKWVDAKPRRATPFELRCAIEKTLAKFPRD